jgi:hypothetical protein
MKAEIGRASRVGQDERIAERLGLKNRTESDEGERYFAICSSTTSSMHIKCRLLLLLSLLCGFWIRFLRAAWHLAWLGVWLCASW